MSLRKRSLIVGAVIALAPATHALANLVVNGDFGTGDYSGWTLGEDSSGDYISPGQIDGSSYQAALTTNADDNGTLSQSFATTSGQMYSLSFVLAGDGATPNSFSVSLGGATLGSLSNVGDTLGAGTPYTYTYTAASSSTALQFTDDDAPGYLYLTNISVTSAATVPEPVSLAAIGIPAAAALLRRRCKLA